MYKKPNQLRAFLSLTRYSLQAQTRNPATFVFGFIFPIVFICIFGLIGNEGQKITVGIPTETNQQNAIIKGIKQQSFVKVTDGSQATLVAQLKRGKLAGIVTTKPGSTPSQLTVDILSSSANPQEASALNSLVKGIVDQTNLKLAGITTPPITIQAKEVSGRTFRYIDFALPGQIGFSLLSTAIFSTVFGFIFLKRALVFKRMFATPVKPLTILLSQGASRLITALLQTILIVVIGVVVFQFYLPHGITTLLEILLLSTIGLVAFLGFGLFLAGLAKDENSASPLVNLVTLPQFLLSGVFFSTDTFPNWLQPIANNLPLSYFNIAMRKITIEGGTLEQTIPYMVSLMAWGIVMYLLAAKTFKWE